MASSSSTYFSGPPKVSGLALQQNLLNAQESASNETQEKTQISSSQFSLDETPISMRIAVIGHPTSGKSTLLESLSIVSYGQGMYSRLLNREIHSSDLLQENCAYTSMPFTAGPIDPPFRYYQCSVDQYEAEAAAWAQPRALTTHHTQPLLGVTCPGLSIVELSSAFDSDRWAFVAPYLCVSDCEIVIFVIDVASPINSEDRLSRLVRSLLSARKKVIFAINKRAGYTDAVNATVFHKTEAFFGQGLDIHNFDFNTDAQEAKKFESHLRSEILEEMRFKTKILKYRPSRAPLSPNEGQMLKTISADFLYKFNNTIGAIIATLTAEDEISRAKFSESDPVVVLDQLSVRLMTYAYSQLCNTLDRFILDQTGIILQKQGFTGKGPYLPGLAFHELHETLYAWFLNSVPVESQTMLVPGAVATVSGAAAAVATFAFSFSNPVIAATVLGATIVGGATGYVFRPAGTVLKEPAQITDQGPQAGLIDETELRNFAWKVFQLKLADRSKAFEALQSSVTNILKNVILGEPAMSKSLDDTPSVSAGFIQLELSYLDSPSIAESQP